LLSQNRHPLLLVARSAAATSAVLEKFVGRDGNGDFPLLRLDKTRKRKHGAISYATEDSEEYQESE
jgi:hypothetical protein